MSESSTRILVTISIGNTSRRMHTRVKLENFRPLHLRDDTTAGRY